MSRPALPRAYAQFGPLFAQFDAPMAEILGGLLASFASRLDLPTRYEDQPQGEFTGFDGISNTGDLAHLLESDWLLRELDADDFIRRIAEREVFYRRPSFEDSGTRHTLAVVLDCGPWMLGRNRLCALAALFHLAAVAERRNAELRWLVPHGRAPQWATGLSRQNISQFLGQVVQDEIGPAELNRALDALDSTGTRELWYVGASQSAHHAEAMDATASFLLDMLYPPKTADARIAVNAAARRTHLDVTYPPETTCLAALRRPFKPEAMARGGASTPTPKSKLPYESHWLLDRFTKSVLIREPEGLLWQPLTGQKPAMWIPLAKDISLLGLRFSSSGYLTFAVAQHGPSTGPKDVATCRVCLFSAQQDAEHLPVLQNLSANLRKADFPKYGVPILEGAHNYSVTRSTGAPLDLEKKAPSNAAMRVFWSATHARVDISTVDLTIDVTNRKSVLLRRSVDASISSMAGQRRHVLFSPSTKTLALSRDGATYTVLSAEGEQTVTLPAAYHLLHIEASLRATVWEPETGRVLQTSLGGGDREDKTLCKVDANRLRTPRFCPLTGTVFAIEEDEDGTPRQFLPVLVRRDWVRARKINIIDAISEARTVWPAV